ncbi:MAG TPA: hypothetical protein VG325_14035 [Solirubrobacteraceae bacterium]|nr:hypothetical protein [Solirubrobacteraceae bacterium]
MAQAPDPRWWEVRRAQNRKPATYRCPLCGGLLPALSEHMLLFPEGDRARRRHAHSACVLRARRAGRLPTREEWSRAQRRAGESGSPATTWSRLRGRLRRRPR